MNKSLAQLFIYMMKNIVKIVRHLVPGGYLSFFFYFKSDKSLEIAFCICLWPKYIYISAKMSIRMVQANHVLKFLLVHVNAVILFWI